MKNILSVRQAGILIFFSIISIKFITFPAIYGKYAGVDGYLGMAINLMVDVVLFGVLMWVASKNKNHTFNQILERLLGKTITKIILIFMFLFFVVKAFYLVKEFHHYLLNTLFSELQFLYFVVPLLVFVTYFMSRSLRAIGRSAEIFYPIVLFALSVTIVLPYKYLDVTNILPIMGNGLNPVLTAAMRTSFSTGDYFVFILMMGNIKIEKNTYSKLFRYVLFGAGIVFVFYIIFSILYGDLSFGSIMAVGDIPLFASFPSTVGRIDWITINLWTIVALFQAGVLLSFASQCFVQTFQLKKKWISISTINAIMLVLLYLFFLNLTIAIEIVTSNLFGQITILFQALIPVLLFVGTVIKKENGVAIYKEVFTK